ncbi:hypothetical protein NLO40_08705 [Escherichia coli]|nr:hypothetical protein [Escherichia coli]
MITVTTTKVWHSSEKGRRYFSRSAAINAEVRHIIYKLYPYEKPESENGMLTYPGYDIAIDDSARYARLFRRIRKIVELRAER